MGLLKESDDNKIKCIKYGLCKVLLERLTSLEDTDADPFEEIPEDEVSLENVPELKLNPNNSDEDERVVTKRVQTYSAASNAFVLQILP